MLVNFKLLLVKASNKLHNTEENEFVTLLSSPIYHSPPPSILYRSTHANIPTAAQLSASSKTHTPLWIGLVVWALENWTVAVPVTIKWVLLRILIRLPGEKASLSTTQSRS